MSDRGEPTRLGELLDGVLQDSGLQEQIERQSVMDAWEEVVGDQIADVTEPVRVDGGVLFVEVRSSAWLMELDMIKHEILERLNEDRDEGRIEKLRFRLAETG